METTEESFEVAVLFIQEDHVIHGAFILAIKAVILFLYDATVQSNIQSKLTVKWAPGIAIRRFPEEN